MNAIGIVRLMLTDGVISQEVAGKYFPELAESEDERIKKTLLSHFSHYREDGIFLNGITMKQIVGWLEKQGERKSAEWTEDDEIKVKAMCEEGNLKPSEREWLKNLRYRVTKKKSDVFTERDRNIINNICENIQGHFKFSDVCKEDAVRYLRSLEGRIQSKKGLTDEDYKVYKSIIDDAVNKDLALTSIQKEWLKSLEERVQPQQKQEWNEEEHQIIEDAACVILDCVNTAETKKEEERLEELADKLQDLRPQSTWKPSEEQITWLYRATDEVRKDSRMKQVLNGLLCDLKKLREE